MQVIISISAHVLAGLLISQFEFNKPAFYLAMFSLIYKRKYDDWLVLRLVRFDQLDLARPLAECQNIKSKVETATEPTNRQSPFGQGVLA